jgi:hypothetical protein
MEPEGSLPCSQEPATGPYPGQDEQSSHPLSYFFILASIFEVFLPKFLCISRLFHARYMLWKSRLPWFNYSNNIWWAKIMKLLIMQLSPAHYDKWKVSIVWFLFTSVCRAFPATSLTCSSGSLNLQASCKWLGPWVPREWPLSFSEISKYFKRDLQT